MKLYAGWMYVIGAGLSFVLALWASLQMNTESVLGLIMTLSFGLGLICSMMCAALAERFWVPKWEREEKRTGKQPGDK